MADLPEEFEVVVHHGGRMIFSSAGPEYDGGTATEFTLLLDYVCYFELMKMGTIEFGYEKVERVFWVTPSFTMADGLHQVHDDVDALKLVGDLKLGAVAVFLDVAPIDGAIGENYDDVSSMDYNFRNSDDDVENSYVGADVGVVHLIDESDRTSDPEFLQAMENLGIANRRRRMITRTRSDGEEIGFVDDVVIN
ncbi:hypothetical protein LINGRAPRIM_LOCUS208 [Linum grandiflorum]